MVWGNVARPCPVEEKFNRGESNVGCATMCSVARWTYKISGMSCRACTEKKTKTDAKLAEVRSWIGELRGRVEGILSREARGKPKDGGEKVEVDLREEGVEFDEEYEAKLAESLLEDFSPVSSPVRDGFSEEAGVVEEMDVTESDGEDLQQVGFRVVGEDSRHRLLLLPAIVRAKGRKLNGN